MALFTLSGNCLSLVLIVPSLLVLVHGRIIREVPDPHEAPFGLHSHPEGALEDGYLTVAHPDHWNIESLLPKEYNRLVPPIVHGKPVKVRITLNVTQLLSIKEDEQVSRNKTLKVCIASPLGPCTLNVRSNRVVS